MPSQDRPPELILYNAKVITFDERQPLAELVAVRGDRIAFVGASNELSSLRGQPTKAIDCGGRTLLPGFIDAHCHIFAYASSLLAVDCSPSSVANIEELKQALHTRAEVTHSGEWVRAYGYDEFALREKRHPTKHDLDSAVPGHPVRLNHRSGHACVLNTVALQRIGISMDTPDPDDGVIERDVPSGEPSGLLIDMEDYLNGVIPNISEGEFRQAVRMASERLVSFGITSVCDATHTNDVERWNTIRQLKNNGDFKPRVSVMAGANFLDSFVRSGLGYGFGNHDVRLGHAKIMLTLTTGKMTPSIEELHHVVANALAHGFPVAIHAVEEEAVAQAVRVLADANRRITGASQNLNRIEHCSECPLHLIEQIARSGATVVTQPTFTYVSGEHYLSEVSPEMQPWLYPTNSLIQSGVPVAASSDAPVASPNPLIGIYSAATRKSLDGNVVGESERVLVQTALAMYTKNAARAIDEAAHVGSIEAGKLADLVLLNDNPTTVEADAIRDIRAELTLIGGRIVWQS